MALALPLQRPQSIQELDQPFLQLWPHRFDFLYAPHPDPTAKPQWQTESRYPLSDRLIAQGAYLYGVRFHKTTQYCLLDIDAGSPYHPRHDALALKRVTDALEPLGLVSHITVTSSDSGGLHLYFPFTDPLPSWQIGLAVSSLLLNRGFKVIPGWLEVFPNPKHYCPSGQLSLFNGHRLPLQQGSYVLNDALVPISASEITFVHQWQFASQRNDIEATALRQIVLQARRNTYRVTQKAEKFLNDLNAEIELGWTGPGQTNRLLGRITMRSYIFGHILDAPAPLSGDALVHDIIRIAKGLPGFTTWCNHQQDIEQKAQHWAKSIEASPYFPYGQKKPDSDDSPENSGPSWNEQQQLAARDRIQHAVAQLQQTHQWPTSITPRFNALTQTGLSGSTLYRHQDLWHPRQMATEPSVENSPVENPPDPPNINLAREGDPVRARLPHTSPKLIRRDGCNEPDSKDLAPIQDPAAAEAECNPEVRTECPLTPIPQQLRLEILQTLHTAQLNQQHQADQRQAQEKARAQADYIAQLRRWIASNDPILVKEARTRLASMGIPDI